LLKSRLIIEWCLITFLGTLIVGGLSYSGITRRFDNLLYDVTTAWRAAPPSERILIVEIDNQSQSEIGKWPWGRDVHAKAIARMAAAKPSAIAYDVLFVEPSNAENDTALARSMQLGTPVLLPVLYQIPGRNGASHDLFRPIESLARATAGLGTVNLVFDDDGIVRRAQLETRTDSGNLPHLAELAYRQTIGRPSPAYQTVTAASDDLAQTAAADQQSGTIMIPYLGSRSFRHVPFSSVLNGEVPAAFLKDKIIMVGATADGLGDTYPVPGPAGSSMSGIEIQANMLNGLLSNQFVQPLPVWAALISAVIPLWLLMLTFFRLRPNRNLIASLALVAATIALSIGGAVLFGYWMPPGPALIGLLLVYPLWGWRRLEALSDFVSQQAGFLRADPAIGALAGVRPLGLDSVASEATELQSMIGTMRGIQQFMSDIVSGFPDAICVVDKDNRVTMANAAAQDILGTNVKDNLLAPLLTSINANTELDSDELRLADGRTFLIRQVPLAASNAADMGSIIRFADVSRLKDADREREEVLAFLSHDMRAPQAAIISLLEISAASSKDADVWKRVNDYARKTLKLADDFVHHARLAAVPLAQDDANVSGAVAEAIDACWPHATQKQIKINATGLNIEAFIMGDYAALTRAFTNLIDNAVKYGPRGSSVTCAIEVEPRDGTPGWIKCTLIDNGPGVPLGRQNDLFARFGVRGDEGISGSGLGLAYVKTVVDRHGGTITCTSAPDRGTCFTVAFPLLA
jgi:CHASE2 domain-containing sensor protein/signal transduction histidine kinase